MNKLLMIVIALCVFVGAGYYEFKQFVGVKGFVSDKGVEMSKVKQYKHPESFITIEELKQIKKNKDVVIIGTLNPLAMNTPIAGSYTVWRSDYSAKKGEYPYGGMRASKADMEKLLSHFGATPESTIVVYAANSQDDAARLWWQIKLLGHKDVRLLDGGLNAWVGAKLPVSAALPLTTGHYVAPAYSEVSLATFDDVKKATQSVDSVVIDVRSPAENNGTTTKKGAFGPGRIPHSVFIPWEIATNKDSTVRPIAELEKIYGQYRDKNVIPYCQSAVRSAFTYFVLTQALGFEHVRNYDGSWIEWSYQHYEKNNAAVEAGKS